MKFYLIIYARLKTYLEITEMSDICRTVSISVFSGLVSLFSSSLLNWMLISDFWLDGDSLLVVRLLLKPKYKIGFRSESLLWHICLSIRMKRILYIKALIIILTRLSSKVAMSSYTYLRGSRWNVRLIYSRSIHYWNCHQTYLLHIGRSRFDKICKKLIREI